MSKMKLTAEQKEANKAAKAAHAENVRTQNAATFLSPIVQTLDALSAKRESWENTDFKKANEGLYALLGECLDLYYAKFLNANDAERKALRDGLSAKLKGFGVKVQKNTNTLNMLVRYVFASDRKRAHGYAYVLAAAIDSKVQGALLPAFINDAGGIEEIKRQMVKSAEAVERQETLKVATQRVAEEVSLCGIAPLAEVSIGGLTGDYAVLLAKPGVDGVATIVGTLSDISEAMFNTLMKQMAKARAASIEQSKSLNSEVQDMLGKAPANDAALLKCA